MLLLYEPYYQLPKNLFEMRRKGQLSLTAFDVIILFIDRYRISNFIDKKSGKVYIIYTIENLMKDLNIKNRNVLIKAINELEHKALIEKQRGYNKPTKYYIL